MKKGFTLLELLVVIAIIGVLSSVVFASLNTARGSAVDSKRVSELNQIQKALELYYQDNGQYPACNACQSYQVAWDDLVNDLSSYMEVPVDPVNSTTERYLYDSDTGDNNQTYGMMVWLTSDSFAEKGLSDGGFYNRTGAQLGQYYEVGPQPVYCMSKSPAENWWGTEATVCSTNN